MSINCDSAMWSVRHPILVSVVSAVAVGGWSSIVYFNVMLAGVIALGMLLFSLFLWLGPLKVYLTRRCGENV